MILAISATPMEMNPFRHAIGGSADCDTLVAGVGPVETALYLTRFLERRGSEVGAVCNFGVAGAYLQPAGQSQPELLDVCLASEEVLGDFGVVDGDGCEPLDSGLIGSCRYLADAGLTRQCRELLAAENIQAYEGIFITVNGVSGTAARGETLRRRWLGLCENMEGAAVARVCREFGIPFFELRCISNMVEDRNPTRWRLAESCEMAGKTAAKIIKKIQL